MKGVFKMKKKKFTVSISIRIFYNDKKKNNKRYTQEMFDFVGKLWSYKFDVLKVFSLISWYMVFLTFYYFYRFNILPY